MEVLTISETANPFSPIRSSQLQNFPTSSNNSCALSDFGRLNTSQPINMETPKQLQYFEDEDDAAMVLDMAKILVSLKEADTPAQETKNLKRKRIQKSRGSFYESELSDDSDLRNDSMVFDETDLKYSTDIFGRKKAPSGTACEKHKKEKKRCPEDCPMRKHNQKVLDSKMKEQKQQVSDEENHSFSSSTKQIVKMTEELIGQLHLDAWESSSTKLFQFISSLKDSQNEIEFNVKEPKNKEECMEFVQLIMKQLQFHMSQEHVTYSPRVSEPPSPSFEEPSPVEDEFQGRKKRRAVENANYKIQYESLEIPESPKAKKGGATKACEYHTSVHARCPPNCPDRRPVVKIQKQNSDTNLPKPKKALETSASESEISVEIPEVQPLSPSPEKQRKSTSPNKPKKFVSVACDRHKLLHARCPANCPDRLARDAQRMEQLQNETEEA